MKLLIITQKYDINDSNLGVFIDWWDKLAERVDKIYILALEYRSGSTPIEADQRGNYQRESAENQRKSASNIEILSMGKEKGAGFFRKIFGFYAGLFKIIGKTDAILVHMIPKYVILAAPVAFVFRKPIYMWYTGVSAHWQLRVAVLFCKKIFTAHEAAMRISTSKRIITGHGIDVKKFQVPSSKFQVQGPITILSVGRITPSKGHDLIIKVVANLIKLGYDLKLKIIGGVIQRYHENYSTSLKELVRELEIADRVEFSGAVSYDKMPEYLGNAEILINAVPFGGLDKAVLEAMSAGVVPLTSNSAFLSVFPEGVNRNLVFKIGDFEDLKNKLKNILDKKFYQNDGLKHELRNIVVRNHNLDNLILRVVKEIKV